MNSIEKIQYLLNNIDNNKVNKTEKIFINAVKNEFININSKLTIPRISVNELDYNLGLKIIEDIVDIIPEFLYGHNLLEHRKPASEEHNLHFIKQVKGRIIDFIHIFKIDFKFGGDSINIIEKGDSNNYPSYSTDRLYYKSRLIPIAKNANNQFDFEPIRLIVSNYIESDKLFFTSTIFDEVNKSVITEEIERKINLNVFNISQKLYPFIAYDYFTACFNVLWPGINQINESAEIFEPVFIVLYSKYNNINNLTSIEELNKLFIDSIIVDNLNLKISDLFVEKLHEYFKKYSIYRDDELMLKSWWRIDIAN